MKLAADTLARYGHLPLVKPLLDHRLAAKKLNTYGSGFAGHINPVTGRLHPNFKLGGTAHRAAVLFDPECPERAPG